MKNTLVIKDGPRGLNESEIEMVSGGLQPPRGTTILDPSVYTRTWHGYPPGLPRILAENTGGTSSTSFPSTGSYFG